MVITVTDNSPKSINTSLFSLEKQIEGIESRVDKLIKLVSGIDTSGNVISVNGKQGIVELNAQDVGALSNDTVIPSRTSQLANDSGYITASEVGTDYVPVTRTVNNKALSSNITLTASDVGALPDTTHIPVDPVQSDWNETDPDSLAYIQNKPTIPGTVDAVTAGDMDPVTSNAVALAIAAGVESQYDETRPAVQGTNASNITWHCIKLRSGLKICSGRATSVRSGGAYGNIFYSVGTDEIWSYPSNFFTATPMCIMRIAGATKWMWPLNQKKGTNNQTDVVCPASGLTFSNETVYYNILAIGY